MMSSAAITPVETSAHTSVRILRGEAELEAIRPIWENMKGDRDSDPTVFLSILRTRPHVLRPHVMVAYRDGEPQAMLVGRLIDEPLIFPIGYLKLRMKARTLYFVYGGPRGSNAEEYGALFVREICKSLAAGEGDTAYLNFIDIESPLYQAARSIASKWRRDDSGTRQPHFSAVLPASKDEFYASLSSNTRGQARTKSRKLEKNFPGTVRIRRFQSPEEIDALAEAAESIMHLSYQRGLGVGFRDSVEARDQLRRRAERGWLRAYVLDLAEVPVAFWIGDVNQNTFRSDYTAFRSDYSASSPGNYLILRVMEEFCDDPARTVTEVDFAMGYAQYKDVYGNRKRNEAAVYLFAPSAKGTALRLMRGLTGTVDASLKKLLTRLGLLQKIKKRWRAGVTGKAPAASPEKTATAA
ncbi:MAG TPA: GNAT family N-acetyltransferase [Acidobacteriaceae bacterium]|jgi:hypothetical protein|nr:GNAT family N-acetyltransferase [Acidobacteriaceae bacterium]